MAKKAVAYIDLLGFSRCVQNNPEEAIMMLSHFNTILSELNFERDVHPSGSYQESLRSLARRTSNESFEHFMPFSDSVFIASADCSNFIMQIGSFVRKSFMLNADVFANPKNPNEPTASYCIGFDTSDPDNIKQVNIPCHEPAVLFRGGVAFGEVIETTPKGLFNNQISTCNNLMGEAVVRAVKMEGLVKGPRIVFDKSVYEQLNDEAKLYVRELPEEDKQDYYEVLWPAMGYILENREFFVQEYQHFSELFDPAYNLWRYYRGDEVEVQYQRFMELIVFSAIRVFDFMDLGDFIRHKMNQIIKDKFDENDRKTIFNGVCL